VARLLQEDLAYSLQANRKTKEGASHPDRNAQFEHISQQTQAFQQRGQLVIFETLSTDSLGGAEFVS